VDSALIVLPLATFVTSALTGVVGMGGGLLLLVVMTEYLPFAALIPVHGINQLVTHLSRSLISLTNIDLRITIQFALGAVIGATAGSQLVLSISEAVFKLLLGLFILLCLVPVNTPAWLRVPGKWPLVGALTSFCGLFVGATGVLVAPFYLQEKLHKEQLVATKAACQVFIHSTKVLAFIVLGFALGPYLLLIVLMCIMAFLGSMVAKRLLNIIPEKSFYLLFRVIVIVLASRLVYQGIYHAVVAQP
jgi:uncharacterized membrane protein YfcA